MLPKPDKAKLIKLKDFVENAKKVRESFEEQAEYEHEKRIKYGGNNLSPDTYNFS